MLKNEGELLIDHILQLCSITIKKFTHSDLHESLLDSCSTFIRLVKQLPPDKKSEEIFKDEDPRSLKLLEIIIESDDSLKLSMITELFKERNNPIKIAVALYGVLFAGNFSVRHPPTTKKLAIYRRTSAEISRRSIQCVPSSVRYA